MKTSTGHEPRDAKSVVISNHCITSLCCAVVKRDNISTRLCWSPLVSVDCCYELNCDDKRGECDDTEKEQQLAKDLMSPKLDVVER